MTLSMVAAAGYPLIAPTFPPIVFPELPGYSYQEAFDLAGLPTLAPPGVGQPGRGQEDGHRRRAPLRERGTLPGLRQPDDPGAIPRVLRSLAYDNEATIPAP